MYRWRWLTLASFMMMLSALIVHAQETDLKAVLRAAIEAHGGKEKLIKYRASSTKFKGSMDLMGKKIDISGETLFQRPNKLKNIMDLDIGAKKVQMTQVFDGKTMWISVLGKTTEIKDEKILKQMREELQVEGGASLIDMLEKPYQLSAIGEVKVKGKDTIGIRVSKEGQRDFSMFFDKKTHLIAKTETRGIDPMTGQEVTQEKFLSDFHDQKGLKTPRNVVIHKDGKEFMELEITELQPLEKLDDANFTKP